MKPEWIEVMGAGGSRFCIQVDKIVHVVTITEAGRRANPQCPPETNCAIDTIGDNASILCADTYEEVIAKLGGMQNLH